ncbi:hypothetical protein JYK14_17305 [Siccirubricoccus sp. KC 17139]|uniref:Uncharacterized protein n=1 Tax=Siccirubricoccus soli TaxID=2899147 RepID=A0ABT1D7J1_9PROT|nr:hypothetical protein [Siccirubricoccus soli]MCO6417906.1 hypothetical protein [Siccirubricoccus soli]MCP2684041.1 hypothetical protein [Siccirubricoccus soli]
MAHLPEMPSLIVAPLQPAEFRPAYPLVRAVAPRVSLAEWLRFARRATARSRANLEGVTTVRHPGRAFPSGLCCWRRDHDLEEGRVLTAEHIIALDLLDTAPVIDALTAELERIAVRLQCRSLRSVLHPQAAPLADRLKLRGHRLAATLLTKPVNAAEAG